MPEKVLLEVGEVYHGQGLRQVSERQDQSLSVLDAVSDSPPLLTRTTSYESATSSLGLRALPETGKIRDESRLLRETRHQDLKC